MRNPVSVLAAILAVCLLIAVPAFADVTNITLSPVGASGVSGNATILSGQVSGSNPYSNVEVNMSMSQPPKANMVYEGWLIDSKSKALMSIGAFRGNMLSARAAMPGMLSQSPYDTLAVSLEPASGEFVTPTTIVARGAFASGTTVAAANFPGSAVLPVDEQFQRQLIMQRYNLTADQVNNLRMQGMSYGDIAVVANVASRCNKSVTDVASAISQGQTWDQIAATCNTTVASLLTPVPAQAVAGVQQQVGRVPAGTTMVSPPVYYKVYPNGAPVLSAQMWADLSARGYKWEDVAIAANISAKTGESVSDLLRMVRLQGMTWQAVIADRGLDINQMMDVSGWPFSKTGAEERAQMRQQMDSIRQGGDSSAATTPSGPSGTEPLTPSTQAPPSGATY